MLPTFFRNTSGGADGMTAWCLHAGRLRIMGKQANELGVLNPFGVFVHVSFLLHLYHGRPSLILSPFIHSLLVV